MSTKETKFTYVQGTKKEEITLNTLLAQSPYTILYFYPKDNTPGCTTEAKDFSRLLPQFQKEDVQVVGVSKDSVDSHCDFIEKHDLTVGLIADPERVLLEEYDARGEKTVFGKKTTGVIRSTVLLDEEGNIIKTRKNVRAKGHAEKVLDFV